MDHCGPGIALVRGDNPCVGQQGTTTSGDSIGQDSDSSQEIGIVARRRRAYVARVDTDPSSLPTSPTRSPGLDPANAAVKSALFWPNAIDTNVKNGPISLGDRFWWLNTRTSSPDEGNLPVEADFGSGCFVNAWNSYILAGVHSGNPPLTREGDPNTYYEAYAVSLGESIIREWIAAILFSAQEHDVSVPGPIGVCSSRPGTFELFSVDEGGRLVWHSWNGDWSQNEPMDHPAAIPFAPRQPGALCGDTGAMRVIVLGTDGNLWTRQRAADGTWEPSFQVIETGTVKFSSGISVCGVIPEHFHIFAADAAGNLRHGEYRKTWPETWLNLGGPIKGTPAGRIGQEGRFDVFVRWIDDTLRYNLYHRSSWQGWATFGPLIDSSPTAATWPVEHIELFARSKTGTLLNRWHQTNAWIDNWNDTGIEMPAGEPAAVSWDVGRTDVLMRTETGKLWHATWSAD